ncbi:MAG: hypothetical protein AAFQ82_00985 [Myxococcota bacterium]
MPKRTKPDAARGVADARDIEDAVHDKRQGWRATPAKARRRQRRYQRMLTSELRRISVEGEADE